MPIQGPADRVTGAFTNICKDGHWTMIVYHNDVVVKFNDKTIILNTCGNWTQTTKRRMVQASNQFKLGYYVQQRKGVWYLQYHDKELVFDNERVVLRR